MLQRCCFWLFTVPFTLSTLTSCYFEGTHPLKDKASNKWSFLTVEASASTVQLVKPQRKNCLWVNENSKTLWFFFFLLPVPPPSHPPFGYSFLEGVMEFFRVSVGSRIYQWWEDRLPLRFFPVKNLFCFFHRLSFIWKEGLSWLGNP